MKKIQILAIALVSVAIVSCNEKKAETTVEPETTLANESTAEKHIDTASAAIATGHPNAVPETVAQDAPVVAKIRGTVRAVQKGKDGYTATIKDDTGKLFYATISIPNLKDPKQYRTIREGDIIEVQGESWKMGEELHIKVAELK